MNNEKLLQILAGIYYLSRQANARYEDHATAQTWFNELSEYIKNSKEICVWGTCEWQAWCCEQSDWKPAKK